MKNKETKEIRKALKKKPAPGEPVIPAKDLLSTGSTLLNLGCSGRQIGGFAKGHIYLFVGDSGAGKTWVTLSCFAEATINSNFNDYRLIFNNAEHGALMDLSRFFGKSMAERMEEVCSETAEDFYDSVETAIDNGKPFVYLLDSMDAVNAREDAVHLAKLKKARSKGREESGTYGTAKAKVNSTRLRLLVNNLKKSGSILIIICQTRDSLGSFGYGDKKTRSGGKALTFYATLELWSSIKGQIKKEYKEKQRQQGTLVKIRVKKNRIAGKDRTVIVPIYHSFGIDDIGNCIDFLVEEKHWSRKKGGIIQAEEWEVEMKKEDLVAHIEEEGLESELRGLVQRTWDEIEEAIKIKRKSRYD